MIIITECLCCYIIILTIDLADIQQQYTGCYRDGGHGNHVITGSFTQTGSMTIEMCQQFCQRSTNTYFGVEVNCFTETLCNTIRLNYFHQRCSTTTWYLHLYSSSTRVPFQSTCTCTCTCDLSTCTCTCTCDFGTCNISDFHRVLIISKFAFSLPRRK